MNSNLKLYDSQFFIYGCFVNDINSCSLFSFMLTFIQTQILCNFMDLYIYISSSMCYCIHNKQYPQSCLSLSWGWGLSLGAFGRPRCQSSSKAGCCVGCVRTGLGTRLSPCFSTENPEVGFSVVGIRNAITNVFHWLGSWKPTLWLQPLSH